MAQVFLSLAAILSALVALAHVFAGGPVVVPALFGSEDLPANVAALAYFTWHCGTVSLVVMAVAFALAARSAQWRPAAAMAILIGFGFGAVGLAVASGVEPALWATPAPYAFSLIALVGLLGLWLGRNTARQS